jgi:hypothetical protein
MKFPCPLIQVYELEKDNLQKPTGNPFSEHNLE